MTKKSLFGWLALALFSLLVWRSWLVGHGASVLLGDSLFFVPVAMQHLLHGDLSNPFLSPLHDGGGPLTWHGWLYPYLLSRLGWLFSVTSTSGMQVVENSLLIGSAAFFAIKMAPLAVSSWIKGAALVCITALIQGAAGRPEIMADFLIALWLLAYPRSSRTSADYWTAVVLGAIATAQPTVAFLAGVLFSTYLFLTLATRQASFSMARVAVVSVGFAIGLTLIFYPWKLADLVGGILEQARLVAKRSDGNFLGVYFFGLSSPLWGVWFVLAAAVAAVLWRKNAFRPQSKVFYPLLLLSLYLVWAAGMRVSYTAYNIAVFVPLVIYWLLLALTDTRMASMRGAMGVVILGLGAVTLLAQARQQATLQLSFLRGVPAEAAADRIRADLEAGKKVAVTSVLAMADYRLVADPNLRVTTQSKDEFAREDEVVYLHQAATGQRTPRPQPGFVVEPNQFLDGLFMSSLKLANTPTAYNYARYVRATAAP